MEIIYTINTSKEFKDIKIGEIVTDCNKNYYLKVSDKVDAELINLKTGSLIKPKPTDEFFNNRSSFYERENWFEDNYYNSSKYPLPVFYDEISGTAGEVIYYKNRYYIIDDGFCAYDLKSGTYMPIGSYELVIPAKSNIFLQV